MSLKTFSLRRKPTSPAAPERVERSDDSSSLKRGDDKRIMLMNMVKEGKLSVDSALQRAYGMGIASVPYEEPESGSFPETKEGMIFNFGVHKYGRNNKSIKCVIQIDYQEESLSLLQRGQKLKSFPFRALKAVIGGDDSPRLEIQFDDLNEIEIDAGTLEEKNRISRLLLLIIGKNQTGLPMTNDASIGKRKEPIKEGVLEKRGHSAAFLMWPKRFVRLFPGELIYFRVGEEKNESSALSIVSLLPEETYIRKLDENGFLLVTSQKEYAFRVSSIKSDEIEKERNDWVIALQESIKGRRKAGLQENNSQRNDAFHQEEYLKNITKSLNDELEQLGVMLNIIDAPIRASTQVKKVREIVHSLNDQMQTGLFSWKLRHARNQRLSISTQDGGDDDTEFDPRPYMHRQANTFVRKTHDTYSHIGSVQQSSNCSQGSRLQSYDALILPTNNEELQRVSEQLFSKDLTNDRRYSPYPNYRPPSVDTTSEGEIKPYHQYQPGGVKLEIADDYARVNKKVKQKRTNSYVNIDHRYYELNTLGDEAPPLPPRLYNIEDLELGVKHGDAKVEDTNPTVASDAKETRRTTDSPETKLPEPKEEKKNVKSNSFSSIITEAGSVVVPPAPPPPPVGGVPPPPPLPGMASSLLSPKMDHIPNCKMKPLFWSKVPDGQIAQTIWKNAEDRLSLIDITRVEELFKLTQVSDNPKVSDEAKKEEKTTQKSLLDPKKAQNFGIFLSGFKLDASDLDLKLSTFDDEHGLTSEEINALKRFQPTAEELEMFKSYKDDMEKLVKVDKFVLKMCSINNLNSRLDLLLTIRELPEQVQGIEPPIQNLLNACKSLHGNKDFVRLLEYVLSIGNYLNGGTNRGRAYGFRLSGLVKLVDIRSADKKQTVLQFIAEELYEKDLEALMCYKKMEALLSPIDISVKGLTAEVDIMSKDLKKLKNQLEKLSSNFDESFIRKVEDFIQSFSEKLLLLHQQCSEIVQLSMDLKKMYGESPSADFENWLNHVADFIKQLQRAAEAAEQKRKRLTNRQKQKQEFQQVVGEMAEMIKSTKLKAATLPAPKANGRESYEAVVSHTTVVSAANDPSRPPPSPPKPFSFNIGNATVLQLQPAESLEELSFPSKTGWLEKLSGGKRRNRKWDMRFFELTTTGYLHYSKREDGKLSGAIYLRGSPVSVDENDPSIFEIHHEQRVWKLRGDNELEVNDWYQALSYYAQMDSIDVDV